MRSLWGKLGVILLIIGLTIFAYAEAWGADWTLFPGTAAGIHYYDAESINRLPNNIVRVWIKVNFNPFGGLWARLLVQSETGKDVPIGMSLSLIEFNCVEKQFRVLKKSFYAEKYGGEIYSESGQGKWDYVTPESDVRLSMEESLFKIVCK